MEDPAKGGVPEWVARGFRRRSELEPGQRLISAELEIERLEAVVAATAGLDSDLDTIQGLIDRWFEQSERAGTAEARVKMLESENRQLRIQHDAAVVRRDQALGTRDANGMLIAQSGKAPE